VDGRISQPEVATLMYGVAELAGYRRRSYDLWQEMAGSWERLPRDDN
jgi:hypothetical protein